MKIFKSEALIRSENPAPGTNYKKRLLEELNAQTLTGIFGILVPGNERDPYHYHERGDHIIFILSGEGIEIVEDEEFPISAGDVLFIPAGEKHTIVNNSDKDLRYLGFCTRSPGKSDYIEVK